jgi:hypothetical protein
MTTRSNDVLARSVGYREGKESGAPNRPDGQDGSSGKKERTGDRRATG